MMPRGNGKCGGFGQNNRADRNIQNLIDGVRNDVERVTGRLKKYEAMVFNRQVVCGENFKVKVDIGQNSCVHVIVHVPLRISGNPPKLSSCVVGKSLHDPL